jgi:hypothetical protein
MFLKSKLNLEKISKSKSSVVFHHVCPSVRLSISLSVNYISPSFLPSSKKVRKTEMKIWREREIEKQERTDLKRNIEMQRDR